MKLHIQEEIIKIILKDIGGADPVKSLGDKCVDEKAQSLIPTNVISGL